MPYLNSQQLGLFSFNILAGLYISPDVPEAVTKFVFTSLALPICLNISDTNVFYFKNSVDTIAKYSYFINIS